MLTPALPPPLLREPPPPPALVAHLDRWAIDKATVILLDGKPTRLGLVSPDTTEIVGVDVDTKGGVVRKLEFKTKR